MKRLLLLTACMAMLSTPVLADSDITIRLNGELLEAEQPPVVFNSRTLVPVRAVCEAMGLLVDWEEKTKGITIYDEDTVVKLGIDYFNIEVNGSNHYIEAPPRLVNGVTCVPIRAVVEPFGASVGWDNDTRTVIIDAKEEELPPVAEDKPDEAPTPECEPAETPSVPSEEKPTEPSEETPTEEPKPSPTPDEDKADSSQGEEMSSFAFYAQADEEWEFESNGRGYCWVCSYAMLITNITGEKVTPVDIAEFNIEKGFDGNYIAGHFGIADKYGLKFVPAISEDSEYFENFDKSHRGATYFKAETDEDVKNALVEALENNPSGIMVRFDGYPHTLIATEYKDGEIYFNDPGQLTMENVTFENTVLGKRFKWTDLTFVQAMEEK